MFTEGSFQDATHTPSWLARSTHTQVHDSAADINAVTGKPISQSQRFFGFKALLIGTLKHVVRSVWDLCGAFTVV